jgi:hypothetical protein
MHRYVLSFLERACDVGQQRHRRGHGSRDATIWDRERDKTDAICLGSSLFVG